VVKQNELLKSQNGLIRVQHLMTSP
jgi:hypothetical protein